MAEECAWYSLTCHLGNKVEEAVTGVSENIVQMWAGSVLEGLDRALLSVGTFWVAVPTPDVSSEGSAAVWARTTTGWLVVVLGTVSLIVACICLIWSLRGDKVRDIARGLLSLVMVSAASVTVGQAMIDVSDRSATWIIQQATGDASGNFATKLLTVSTLDTGAVTLLLTIVLGVVGVLANLVQIGVMFVRSAMLILLLAVAPLAAAASMTEQGWAWLRRLVTWFTAFVAVKPAAALVYGVAVRLVEGDSYNLAEDDELLSFVLGVIMMVLAALALPALLRFMVPLSAAVGGGGGAGAAAAGLGGLATGAASVVRPAGRVGAAGPAGAAGRDGGTGSGGPAGAGEAGPSGADGSAGTRGGPGSGGATGARGGSGAGGGEGASGAAGASGASGSGGATGAAGSGGATGAAGAGSAGAGAGAGAAGAAGPAGAGVAVAAGAVKGVQKVGEAARSAAEEGSGTGSQEVAR